MRPLQIRVQAVAAGRIEILKWVGGLPISVLILENNGKPVFARNIALDAKDQIVCIGDICRLIQIVIRMPASLGFG